MMAGKKRQLSEKQLAQRRASAKLGGRPKGSVNVVTASIRELAQPYGAEAVKVLAEIMRDKEAKPAERKAAAAELLDRGYGKSMQAVEVTGADGGPVSTKAIIELTNDELARIAAG